MLKCQDVDKFDFKFVKKMKPDILYKLKDKTAIAYIDNKNYKMIAYSYDDSQIAQDYYQRCGNVFNCLYNVYAVHLAIFNARDMHYFNQAHLLEDTRTAQDILDGIKGQIKKAYPDHIEIGVELELEPERSSDLCIDNDCDEVDAEIWKIDKQKLIEDIKSDCSVYGGTELNLKHMPLSKWSKCGIKSLLKRLRDNLGFDNRYGTAGMHVHVSGPRAINAARQLNSQREELGQFFNLVGFRRAKICTPYGRGSDYYRYGTGTDAIKDQIGDHGTCEFRCFEVTTDYDLFMVRLAFVREVFLYLGAGRKIKDFAKKANKRARSLFMQLYNDERNPHAFGVLDETELKLMEA